MSTRARRHQAASATQGFKHEVLVRLMVSVCTFVLSTGLISSYSICIERNVPIHDRDLVLVWMIKILMALAAFINIIAIIINTNTNYRFRNLRQRRTPYNPMLLYVLCLPLFSFTIIGIILVTTIDVILKDSPSLWANITDIIYYIVETCNLFLILILVLDIRSCYDTGEEWALNFISCFTSISTVVSLWVQLAHNVILKSTGIFSKVADQYFPGIDLRPTPKNDSFETHLIQNLSTYIHFKFEADVIAMLVLTPYLLESIHRNLNLLLQNMTATTMTLSLESLNRAPLFSFSGLTISLVFACIYYASVRLFSNDQSLQSLIFFHFVQMLVPAVGIFMSLVALEDIKYWKRASFRGFFHFSNIVIYLGVFGDLSVKLFDILLDLKNQRYYQDFPFVIENMLQIIFIVSQATLMSIILERHPQRTVRNGYNHWFCPHLFLIMYNIFLFLDSYYLSFGDVPSRSMHVKVTLLGLIKFCGPLVLLYRTHFILTHIGNYIHLYKLA